MLEGSFLMLINIPLVPIERETIETIFEESGLADLSPFDVWDMLLDYLRQFKPCFCRKEQFEHFLFAVIEVLGDLGKKNLTIIPEIYSTPSNNGDLVLTDKQKKIGDMH
jgi:hypothetical protein